MNLNQMRKIYQIFGCVYSWQDITLNSQLKIPLQIHLANSLDNSIEIFNGYFAICICTPVVYQYVVIFESGQCMYLRYTLVMRCTKIICLYITKINVTQIFNGKNISYHMIDQIILFLNMYMDLNLKKMLMRCVLWLIWL